MINLEQKLSEVSYTIEMGYDSWAEVIFTLVDYKVLEETDLDNLSGRVTYEVSTDQTGPVEITTTFEIVDGDLVVDFDNVDWSDLEEDYINHESGYDDEEEDYGDDDFEPGDDW